MALRFRCSACSQMYRVPDSMGGRTIHCFSCGQAVIARKAVQDVNRPMPRLATDFRGGLHHNTAGASDWSLILTGVPY